jgi:hypothetical protein
MHVVGIDLIGPYLGEINGVSPGMIHRIDRVNGMFFQKGGCADRIKEWAYAQKKSF